MAKQLQGSNAKLVITTTELYWNIHRAVVALRKDIKIICIPTVSGEELPNGSIHFNELIDTKGE